MLESADSSSDETISYLEDVDSDIGEFYADAEPPTGPQPHMHEPKHPRARYWDRYFSSYTSMTYLTIFTPQSVCLQMTVSSIEK